MKKGISPFFISQKLSQTDRSVLSLSDRMYRRTSNMVGLSYPPSVITALKVMERANQILGCDLKCTHAQTYAKSGHSMNVKRVNATHFECTIAYVRNNKGEMAKSNRLQAYIPV